MNSSGREAFIGWSSALRAPVTRRAYRRGMRARQIEIDMDDFEWDDDELAVLALLDR